MVCSLEFSKEENPNKKNKIAMENFDEFNSLKGKTVVITGASSGVGKATAEAFAMEGCNVVLAARGKEALDKAAGDCRKLGAIALSVPTDVSVAEQVKNLTEEALQLTGRIDVWVNNAGVMASGKFEEIPSDTTEQVIKTNLLGYINSAHAVLPIFKKQKEGVLLNNVSIGGFIPAPYSSAYSATKFGIRGMIEGLRAEVSNYPNIHISALYPGLQRSTGNMHSSKYSGLDFKIPPFAADPKVMADALVRTAKKPKKNVYPNLSSWPLIKIYRLFPNLIGATAAAGMRLMMKKNAETDTDGNVLNPSNGPMQIYGETSLPPMSEKTKKVALIGLAFVAGFYIMKGVRKVRK